MVSTDIATLLDLACIKYTGLPMPDEFTSKTDWSYTIVDGKKVAKYTIPNSILANPFTFSYPNPFTLQIKRRLITDELKGIWEGRGLAKVNLEDFYYGYYVLKLNGGTWRGDRFHAIHQHRYESCMCPIPTDILEGHLRPLCDTIETEIELYDKRIKNRQFRDDKRGNNAQYEQSPNAMIRGVLSHKTKDLSASQYHTLFNILEIVIGESNDKVLQEYFTNWDKKTQQEKFGGKVEDISKAVYQKTRRWDRHRRPPADEPITTYRMVNYDNQRGSLTQLDYHALRHLDRWSADIRFITLKNSDNPIAKKDTWREWFFKINAANRVSEIDYDHNAQVSFGGAIKRATDKRKNFWSEVKKYDYLDLGLGSEYAGDGSDLLDWRKEGKREERYHKENLVKSILKMGGISV